MRTGFGLLTILTVMGLNSATAESYEGKVPQEGTPLEILKKEHWQVTGNVRGAFLAKAEKTVLADLDKTPWPLLVPLSKTLPLKEADYIWEKLQGKHGGKILHTYGPYSRAHKSRGLEPDPRLHCGAWHWP